MTKPISPDGLRGYKPSSSRFPPEVFDAFNDAIAETWDGKSAVVDQDDVIKAIIKRLPSIDRFAIFEHRWLDIEGAYHGRGWSVTYDKPGYNESGPATFTFTRRSR